MYRTDHPTGLNAVGSDRNRWETIDCETDCCPSCGLPSHLESSPRSCHARSVIQRGQEQREGRAHDGRGVDLNRNRDSVRRVRYSAYGTPLSQRVIRFLIRFLSVNRRHRTQTDSIRLTLRARAVIWKCFTRRKLNGNCMRDNPLDWGCIYRLNVF